MSSLTFPASTSRSRPQQRRKATDDLAYIAPSSSAIKRQAQDRAEGEPRQKRKKADQNLVASASVLRRSDTNAAAAKQESEDIPSVNFATLPMDTLFRYLSQHDIIPLIQSPLFTYDPLPPSCLENPPSRAPSVPPSSTPANRPRRDPKEGRRRSSRLAEDELPRTPILADLREMHTVLAGIVEAHFKEQTGAIRELDTLASFMSAVEKSKGPRSRF